eukprot:CAMPEP_0184336038 /NCGR_PEP_ID=MMETSP1089-20130417/4486_1 /TAXON_ID=38269 ORGANISM="Gloeochaete wittrockiana, Strain SAG46.84" /NCGR_SAMPLE_ID=MMETSP1089 /ASSEMBLY_ACC=CAM_ASM_000445 /LENGTH=314 /DNA_ID=CAMNT_0026660965 /DNA_START=152 /DNA_END=1096 /DNA_ORIENTATION=+
MAIGGGGGDSKAIKEIKFKDVWIDAVAGGASGALEICVTYPFEFAKTQVQLDPKTWGSKPFWACWKDTYHQFGGFPKGFTALYRGMPPLIIFGVPRNACRFVGFEVANNFLKLHAEGLGTVQRNILAGLAGGVTEAVLVTTYQETMKVRLIHDRLSPNPRFKNTFHGISTIFREQGFSGVYKGLGATILRQGSNQAIRFPTYYYLKSWFCDGPDGNFAQNGPILGIVQQIFVGATAGAASVIGNTPIDVVKTKMQGFEANQYNGVVDCIAKTWKTEGFGGFYKGVGARMGRVSVDVALTFFFVEKIKSIVKSHL